MDEEQLEEYNAALSENRLFIEELRNALADFDSYEHGM